MELYAFDVAGALLILTATSVLTIESLAYPIYIFAVNSFVIFLVKRKDIMNLLGGLE